MGAFGTVHSFTSSVVNVYFVIRRSHPPAVANWPEPGCPVPSCLRVIHYMVLYIYLYYII